MNFRIRWSKKIEISDKQNVMCRFRSIKLKEKITIYHRQEKFYLILHYYDSFIRLKKNKPQLAIKIRYRCLFKN